MTELQMKQLNMLRMFIHICDELNIKYYLVCGSALGAVKYGGFIPWDDDVDVGLFREDYNVFLREAQKRLPEHIFLQNYLTDPKYPNIFSKLRDSSTTYIENSVSHLNMNHGVYIDVFPLDGYPKSYNEQEKLEKIKRSCEKKLSCVFKLKRNTKAKVGYGLRRLMGYHRYTQKILEKYTNCISQYGTENANIICNHGNWQGKLEYAPREQYGEGMFMTFEGINVRVPERYDEYLTQKYGDWRSDVPSEKKIGHHYYTIMDLNKPYSAYIK